MWGRWFVRMWRYGAGVWGCVFVGDWRCLGVCVRGGLEVRGGWGGGGGELRVKIR